MSKKIKVQNHEINGPVGAAGSIQNHEELPPTAIKQQTPKSGGPRVTFQGAGSHIIHYAPGKNQHVRFLRETAYQYSTDNQDVIKKMDELGFDRLEK